MISPILFASILNALTNNPVVPFNDFIDTLTVEEQTALLEESIDDYQDLDSYIFAYYSNQEGAITRSAQNDYVSSHSSSGFLSTYYPEFTWTMIDNFELAYVSGHEPVSIGGDLFPETDVSAGLQNTLVEQYGSNYGGCGPRAMIGIFDYLARYLNYYEFMANPTLSADRVALAHSVFQGALTFSMTPEQTFMGPLSYSSCFSSVVFNNGLSNRLYINYNISGGGDGQTYLDRIVTSIRNGLPITVGTFPINQNIEEYFAYHYFNVYGIETWTGVDPISGATNLKKLLKCKGDFVNDPDNCYFVDSALLNNNLTTILDYHIYYSENYNTTAQTYASFVNNEGGGQYFYYEKYGSISLDEYKSISFNRLRCSYILNQYLVLSPNRVDAGIAHLYLSPSTIRSHYLRFDAALWSDYEEIENQSFFVEYYGSDAQWHHLIDYDLNVFSTNRDSKLTFNVLCPRDAHGIRFKTIQPNPSGTYNRGRIVLDNIKISGNL